MRTAKTLIRLSSISSSRSDRACKDLFALEVDKISKIQYQHMTNH